MRKICYTVLCLVLVFLLIGCASQKNISDVKSFESEEHKAIYNILEKNKEKFNNREMIDTSDFTEDAVIMTQYNDEKIKASPKKLKEIWPKKLDTFKKHKFKIRSINVQDISIQGDTAEVKSLRTCYSRRWNKFYKYRFKKTYKKVNGEWKLHSSKYEEI